LASPGVAYYTVNDGVGLRGVIAASPKNTNKAAGTRSPSGLQRVEMGEDGSARGARSILGARDSEVTVALLA